MRPEYYLRVGQYELDFDYLPMGQWSAQDERGCLHTVPHMSVKLMRTPDTRRIHAGDRVELFMRGKGGKDWGSAVFAGQVLLREPRVEQRDAGGMDETVRVTARGMLSVLDELEVEPVVFTGTLKEMLEQWVELYCRDLADAITINVTQPEIFPPEISIDEGTPWTVMAEIRRYCPIDVRLRNIGTPGMGQRGKAAYVLEITDEKIPNDWENYTADELEARIITKADLLEPSEECIAIRPRIRPPSWMDEATGEEYKMRAALSLTALRTNGRVILLDFDPSPGNPLRNPNELIMIPGREKPVAVQAVKLYRQGPIVTARLTWTSRVLPYWVPRLMPGGCNARASPVGQRTHGALGLLRGLGRQV